MMTLQSSVINIIKPRLEQSKNLITYWYGLCSDGNIPNRADIKPGKIPVPLDHVFLMRVDRNENNFDFMHSIIGTMIVKASGCDYSGKYLSECSLPYSFITNWSEIYKKVCLSVEPLSVSMPFPDFTKLKGYGETTLLPLGVQKNVSHILGYSEASENELSLSQQLGCLIQRIA